jgi:hypothetical protein
MKTYNTVDNYITEAKQNDIIVLAGKGLMDGIKSLNSKHDTHKVIEATNEKLVVKAYRGKTRLKLSVNSFDQQIALLTKKEFNNLKVLW